MYLPAYSLRLPNDKTKLFLTKLFYLKMEVNLFPET
jgi:hypothetical protein